jgi:POT family proton-dependent oligopeptide transporter
MLSGMWEGYEDKSDFFLVNCALALLAGIMMFAILRWLNQVMREKNIL